MNALAWRKGSPPISREMESGGCAEGVAAATAAHSRASAVRRSGAVIVLMRFQLISAPHSARMKGMPHIIVGTAGHIDHGKTSLVKALTGIDADRLKEEKERGITIDIGFANLVLDDETTIGFIDVPGHERFVKNMLAGIGGIDAVMLVIAADESVMPQTREHLDICSLLHVKRGLTVLTKIDATDPDIVDLAEMEVREYLDGSFLQDAPLVRVSALSGEGIGQLKDVLAQVTREVPPKDASQIFRLPVDRCFSMKGFGTVVSGTLIAGRVRRE